MPKRRERDPRRQFKDETGSLQRMGEALGWRREEVEASPVRYSSEEGFSGGPAETWSLKEDKDGATVDAIRNVGSGYVKVKPKFPTKNELKKDRN